LKRVAIIAAKFYQRELAEVLQSARLAY
jgi:hypothetical protein